MATTNTSGPRRQVSPSICPVTGDCTYALNLTPLQLADHVRLTLKPVHTLPIVFVPGIMGSNLKGTAGDYPATPVQSTEVQQRIKQFFDVPSVEHEPAYQHPTTQLITAYAIAKIAAALPSPSASTSTSTSPRRP